MFMSQAWITVSFPLNFSNFLGVVNLCFEMNEISIFYAFEPFHFLWFFKCSTFGCSLFATFSIFPFLGRFGLQFWILGAPIWSHAFFFFRFGVPSGPFWLHLGSLWFPLGSIWLPLAPFGSLWHPFGFLWLPLGLPWLCVGSLLAHLWLSLLPTFSSSAAPWSGNLP